MGDCDVLIVGAGPVGTALALELAHQDVSFRVVDKAPIRSDKSRAFVVQPRTLELLNRHGQAQSFVSSGQLLSAFNIISNGKLVTKVVVDNLGTVDTAFTLPVLISQTDTERFLDQCLSKYGKAVERPVIAEEITQDGSGVGTTLLHSDGSRETVRSK